MTDKDKDDDKPDETTSTEATPTSGVKDIRWKIFGLVGVGSLVADQVTKVWARAALGDDVAPKPCSIPYDLIPSIVETRSGPQLAAKCHGVDVPFLGDFWSWKLSMNTGSAFGLFGSNPGVARILLTVVGIVAVVGMVWMLRKARPDQRILQWALAFVAGGAVGNLIDRAYFGAVTDMVHWRIDSLSIDWPVFNVADVVLVVGVGLMFIDIQKEGKREKAAKAARKEARERKKRVALGRE